MCKITAIRLDFHETLSMHTLLCRKSKVAHACAGTDVDISSLCRRRSSVDVDHFKKPGEKLGLDFPLGIHAGLKNICFYLRVL